ncbi:zinc finger protein 518A isoform X2 [Sphaeramia orbicularis]|uniref:zinc finger protein 518A isoform X2 n=1 Tax=Sphaeramia orbicularis TaxID=375764 RepID=UPI00117DD36A|nr:zinc finger protein 518A-like isoform X2 [Sphaeramia orbicularis]
MDSLDICAATSTGDNKRRVNKKNRDWHSRLHLRKTAVQPPTMQSEDKHGPKKIAEEWEQSTMWPSSKKPRQEAQRRQRRTNNGGNSLRFTCSQCKDNLEYVPKDLVRHFEENHRGSPPVFSCHMCTFNTHEFSYLQVHLLSHKDTFSSCSICKDNVQRTWSEFSAHLTMCHCQNGKYSCEICNKFSTGDDSVFLEHICLHNLSLDGTSELEATDNKQFRPQTTTQTLRCQYCDYEASQKLLTKHINAVHGGQNCNQKKKEVHSFAMKPNDPIPKIKPRLTRSAVREMCWLTQDCLSLPGREFLDKYCHLSDPQTTLEETQQFLMKSVAGETGKQKWTKALKTVLSNVPQDMNLHPKAENGIMSNSVFPDSSRDVTVLTVQNKITVAQNGATYAKRLKMMASSEKETVSAESTAADARCVFDQNGCESNLNENTHGPQAETKLSHDVLIMSVQNETSECTQMQENRENQELKTDLNGEEHSTTSEEPKHLHPQDDGVNISNELKMQNDNKEQTCVSKALPKKKRRNQRAKRKTRSKKADASSGLALKIVLKKNPVKEKQWVSQSSVDGSDEPPDLQSGVEETAHPPPTEIHQKKVSKTDMQDPSGAITSTSQKPGDEVLHNCTLEPEGPENVDANGLEGHQDAQKPLQILEKEEDRSVSGADTRVEMCLGNVQLQACDGSEDCHVSDKEKDSGVTPCSSYTKASPVSQPVITPQADLSVAVSSHEPPVDGMREGVAADAHLSKFTSEKNQQQSSPTPAPALRRQPVPKNLERTLNLVAINANQLIKRPAGDQPVVVLNHPDADIPEVTRIMEVVNRYKGEVRKVVLSRRTLNALSDADGEVAETNDPSDADTESDPASLGKTPVQERFVLKLKLRRLSRKKYEVVNTAAASPSRDVETKFSCWFCGRVFACQETWMVHRQRHLMEWKSPNCENS